MTDFTAFINLSFSMFGHFFYINLGKIIFHLREKKGLTQEQLCLLCDINRSYLFKIEKGTANPSIKVLNKICRVFRIKICDLLKRSQHH
ncbi:MAG: helix-turn-helix transcriptional regulator [Patescibacteria group bacterium]